MSESIPIVPDEAEARPATATEIVFRPEDLAQDTVVLMRKARAIHLPDPDRKGMEANDSSFM